MISRNHQISKFIYYLALAGIMLGQVVPLSVTAQDTENTSFKFCLTSKGTAAKEDDPSCSPGGPTYNSDSYISKTDKYFWGVCVAQVPLPQSNPPKNQYVIAAAKPNKDKTAAVCQPIAGQASTPLDFSSFYLSNGGTVNSNVSDTEYTTQGINDPLANYCIDAQGEVHGVADSKCAELFSQSTSSFLIGGKFYGVCAESTEVRNSANKTITQYTSIQPTVKSSDKIACSVGHKFIPPNTFVDLSDSAELLPNQTQPSGPVRKKNPPTPVAVSGDCEGLIALGALCLPPNPFSQQNGIASAENLKDLIPQIINFALWLAGLVAIGMIIFGGYQTMTAAGNDEQAKDGRKTLTNAIYGLIIIIFSYAIVNIVTNLLIRGNK